MEKYKKEKQYYIDKYDRETIRILKKMENEAHEKGEELIADMDFMRHLLIMDGMWKPDTAFYEKAATRAQLKDDIIRQWMFDDEQCDRLVERHSTPEGIKCNVCNTRMWFNGHIFNENNASILFAFKCPKDHKPQKIVYPNGDECFFPKKKCVKCRGEIESTSVKDKNLIICKDKCLDCGYEIIDEFDMGFLSEEDIDEKEREKYCTDFKSRKTFAESLMEVARVAESIQREKTEQQIKEEYRIDQIEKPNIPQIELRLSKLTEELGYVKFQLGQPDMDRHIVVEFSVQDPTVRTDRESELLLMKSINENLFPTCWRLMSQGVSYRMGYITGKLKAYTDDEGLLKIGKEIQEAKK